MGIIDFEVATTILLDAIQHISPLFIREEGAIITDFAKINDMNLEVWYTCLDGTSRSRPISSDWISDAITENCKDMHDAIFEVMGFETEDEGGECLRVA